MADVVRLKNPNGTVVTCDEVTAAKLGSEWKRVDGPAKTAEPEGYAAMKVADLKAEIDRRNEGREDADLIPGDGKKAELVAALEADDEANAPSDDE